MFNTNKLLKMSIFQICLMLILSLLLTILLPITMGNVANATSNSTKESRLLYYVDNNIEGMNLEYSTSVTRKTTKTLHDFAGNTYTLIECNPTGYMIMCDDSATMVEYSGESPSPYAGYTNNLYYIGPTYYYVYENNQYIHTITDEVLNYNPNSQKKNTNELDPIVEVCDTMHSDLVADANLTALNYIKTGNMPKTEIIGLYGNSWTCVNFMQFFAAKRTSTQIGYMGGGYCGYIAAAMLIGYYDTFIRECMNDSYMTGSGTTRHFTGSSLTNLLVTQFGNGSSTTSTTIRHTMNSYFNYYGYNLGSYDMITPFFSGSTLRTWILKNTPMILFGNLGYATQPVNNNQDALLGPKGDNHAVIIYGYKNGGTGGALYSFLAHFGWSGYSMSTINYVSYSVFGSMYRITL